MLSVPRVHLPSEIPVVVCEITPYVLIRRPDSSISNEDVSEAAPLGGCYMRYKWHRIQSDRKVAVCSIHLTEQATLQCMGCLKEKVPPSKSFHCSPKCFSDAWQHHLVLHDQASNAAVNGNGIDEEELFGRIQTSSVSSLSNGFATAYTTSITERNGGETWFEVGNFKTYTATAEDIGHVLKFECVPIDAETKLPVASSSTVTMSWVFPAPSPCPRCMIQVSGADFLGHFDRDGQSVSSGTFTVLSYNILVDQHATSEIYSYCPSWALAWHYRRQNLMKEITGYHADIVCLQEVQSDHFEDFFSPELDKHGYQALYKKKTTEVEFNKAAQSLSDAVIQPGQKKFAFSRLIESWRRNSVIMELIILAKGNFFVWQIHTWMSIKSTEM